jgi:hypothetical protein
MALPAESQVFTRKLSVSMQRQSPSMLSRAGRGKRRQSAAAGTAAHRVGKKHFRMGSPVIRKKAPRRK